MIDNEKKEIGVIEIFILRVIKHSVKKMTIYT